MVAHEHLGELNADGLGVENRYPRLGLDSGVDGPAQLLEWFEKDLRLAAGAGQAPGGDRASIHDHGRVQPSAAALQPTSK